MLSPHRWPPAVEPEDLGAVVHGPVVLARATGIVAALRCVFAHADGLSLPFVLRAEGVQAEAALRQSQWGGVDEDGPQGWSEPAVAVRVGGHEGFADPSQARGSGGEDAYDLDATFWIDVRPEEVARDHRLELTVAWPQAGLPETTTVLTLRPWTAGEVLPLL
ncbi:hypothetical protein AB2L27_12470 [Kineococcus sp. LSe6-4]|uniref:Uncharacterized protein n=1 Tax=Kineococcus halophytocola TaxID=3234027 RepID=A0ABV4H1Y1_9ACTN